MDGQYQKQIYAKLVYTFLKLTFQGTVRSNLHYNSRVPICVRTRESVQACTDEWCLFCLIVYKYGIHIELTSD